MRGDHEKKRWQLARLLVWGGLILATAVFWLAVGHALVGWMLAVGGF